MTHSNHAILFRLLAQALTYPETTFAAQLQQTISTIDLNTLDNPQCALPGFITAVGNLKHIPLEHIQAEHTRLFINAYPHLPCPPYESAYREGVLLGNAAEAVNRIYREHGIVVTGEEVDHAAVELEFMAFLLTLADDDAIATARSFLESHLLKWMPDFAADIRRASKLDFFRETGILLGAFLENMRTEFSRTTAPAAQIDFSVH